MSHNDFTLQPEKTNIYESPVKEKLCRVKWQVILFMVSTRCIWIIRKKQYWHEIIIGYS